MTSGRAASSLFFKPAAGYGSKAAYRGDKLTKRVFEEILDGDYVAQALVPPSARRSAAARRRSDLKLDLRNYVYRGRVQLVDGAAVPGPDDEFPHPRRRLRAGADGAVEGDVAAVACVLRSTSHARGWPYH
jgi:hypothetical protein